ncbi:hypothetical protein ACQKDD_18185 [Planococcus kocurii]|uniref:hypothetical protein n=1 Tax=Planococcus TaxID=1372 RepID=UPI0011EF3A01|nr:hypothetical protein [Planococcus sp. ANT_H30]KAA0958134.1 hypothetical protein FQ085_00020 [Planococcus sp. ANT_H30]
MGTTQYNDSIKKYIANLVLQILSRILVKEVYRKWKATELTAVEAMKEAGVKKTSFYKLVKALEEETGNLL